MDHPPLPPDVDPLAPPAEQRRSLMQRRRDKIIAEIERNRHGDYRVPTWVFAVALVLIVVAWAAVIAFA